MVPVILAGGSGKRLWPLSHAAKPKQFLKIRSKYSLFQNTLLRARHITNKPPIILTGAHHEPLINTHINELKTEQHSIILEPLGRNTAPAIAAAALYALQSEKDAILMVLPSDHIIENTKSFQQACRKAQTLAAQDYIVTFGIKPTCPHTGYGYIAQGTPIDDSAHHIKAFKEKPDKKTAQNYLDQGYLWNSGIFIFKAATYIEELEKHCPDMIAPIKASIAKAHKNQSVLYLDPESFSNCPSISIDYAIMEHTDKGAIIQLDTAWRDIGTWRSLLSL